MKKEKSPITSECLGWREWTHLPELTTKRIKAKIDTGATTSSLHVSSIQRFRKAGKKMVRFCLHPKQKCSKEAVVAEAELLDERLVKNPNGSSSKRPVIKTTLCIGEGQWPVQINLVNRDMMGFRFLVGREALRGRFLVDPGRSYLSNKRKSK